MESTDRRKNAEELLMENELFLTRIDQLKVEVAQHRQYAHMMQEQRTKIADYCRQLEKDIATLKPESST